MIGGLDGFLKNARTELNLPQTIDVEYSKLTPKQRADWAFQITQNINYLKTTGSDRSQIPESPRKIVRDSQTRRLRLSDKVSILKSVTKGHYSRLNALGLNNVTDLIWHFPHRHNDYSTIRKVSELTPGQEQTVVATVWESSETGPPRRRSTQAVLGDDTGNFRAIWFNQPYMTRVLKHGTEVVISGRVDIFKGRITFRSPEYEYLRDQEQLLHTGRLVPVYPSTERLPQRTLRRIIREGLTRCKDQIEEYLPTDILSRTGLQSLQNAVGQIHYPSNHTSLNIARKRLAFDELFMIQLAVARRRQEWREPGTAIQINLDVDNVIQRFLLTLPFTLTNAQTKVLNEITNEIQKDIPMSRLIQGDVGSGKTVVAASAMLATVASGYQCALMAPTEILAEQHFATICSLFSQNAGGKPNLQDSKLSIRIEGIEKPVRIGLLLGSLKQNAKKKIQEQISNHEIDIVVGTQALIQDSINIPNLALAIVDEQHRFGVLQRSSLREKGQRPHVLAMSATPIPRSLALTLCGDLDISTIDELPGGRKPIKTRWIDPDRRHVAYEFVRRQIRDGRQAFIVFPLVEESDMIQARAATVEYDRLSKEVYPELKLGLLHGRMTLKEKELIMDQFQRNVFEILVSTSVIEVGIDVPNATTIVIDGAHRFGLSQIHQFRGRVGRGVHQSYCLLLADSPGEDARERLKTVERVSDGFQLAEEDLRLRGPGDYLGTRQSGLHNLRVARISDTETINLARREAKRILDVDPDLSDPQHHKLRKSYAAYYSSYPDELS